MKNISNGQCNDEVLRSLFMEQLPPLQRQILAPSSIKNLTELAQIADKIREEKNLTNNTTTATSVAAI